MTTRCLESLCAPWDIWFGKLKAFKERFGHCNVETGWEEDPALAGWVGAQRTRRSKGELYPERIRLLEELGFVWDYQAQKTSETWMKWYGELEDYAREHGNPHVPRGHENTRLASWVMIQRYRREKAYGETPPLTEEQVALLDKLGFRWDPHEEKWAARLEQLKHFKERHGHCETGLVAAGDDDLRSWANTQRSLLAQGKLEIERKAQLDAIGFPWTSEIEDRRWNEMYECLKNYHTQHGNADVPNGWKENPKLAAWLSRQRERRKKGQMADEQVRLLDLLRGGMERP